MYDSLGDFGSGLVNPGGRFRPGADRFHTAKLPSSPSDEILPTHSLLTTRVVFPILHLEGVLHPLSRVPHTLTVETPFGSAGVEGTELVLREGEGETALWVSEGQ